MSVHLKFRCQKVCRRDFNVLVHDGEKLLGDLLGNLHKIFRVILLYILINTGLLLRKAAASYLVTGIDPENMGFQKVRKIRTIVKHLVGQHRHTHCGIQNMYDHLSDMDLFLICYHVSSLLFLCSPAVSVSPHGLFDTGFL